MFTILTDVYSLVNQYLRALRSCSMIHRYMPAKMNAPTLAARVAALRAEQAQVSDALALGEEGIRILRNQRVASFVLSVTTERTSPEARLGIAGAILDLAIVMDAIISGCPNSLTDVEIKQDLGVDAYDTPYTMAVAALKAQRVRTPAGVVSRFVQMYHRMHARGLITTDAVDTYSEVAKQPGVVRSIIEGRQSTSLSHGSVRYRK